MENEYIKLNKDSYDNLVYKAYNYDIIKLAFENKSILLEEEWQDSTDYSVLKKYFVLDKEYNDEKLNFFNDKEKEDLKSQVVILKDKIEELKKRPKKCILF